MMISIQVLASDKKREWLDGKLIDIVNEPYTQGILLGGEAHKERITYKIDDGKYIYFASHLHFRHDPALPVTINDKVKFALEKNKVYLMDEKGKGHELKFEKKALKEAEK